MHRSLAVVSLLCLGALSCSSSDGPSGGAPADGGVDDTSPPRVAPTASIEFPRSGYWTNARTGRLRGTASAAPGGAVSSVRVKGVAATSSDGFAHWTAEVPLDWGHNELVVEVEDSLAAKSAQAASVTVTAQATLSTEATDFQVVGDTVYVADAGSLVAIPLAGGPARGITTASAPIVAFTVDGDTIYVATKDRALGSVPRAGGELKVLFNSSTAAGDIDIGAFGAPLAMTTTATDVIVVSSGPPEAGLLFKIPKAGGAASSPIILTAAAPDAPTNYPLVDATIVGDTVYAASIFGVISFKISGGPIATLPLNQTLDGTEHSPTLVSVYDGSIFTVYGDAADLSIYKSPLTGGAPTKLPVFPSFGVRHMQVTADGVLAREQGLVGLSKRPLAGGPPSLVPENDPAALPLALLADEVDLFVFTVTGIEARPRKGGAARKVFDARSEFPWMTFRGTPALAGDLFYVPVGAGIRAISKSAGTAKDFIVTTDSSLNVLGITADETSVYALTDFGVEIYDAKTAAHVRTMRGVAPAGPKPMDNPIVVDATSIYLGSKAAGIAYAPKSGEGSIGKFYGTEITNVETMSLGKDAMWVGYGASLVAAPFVTGPIRKIFDATNKPAIWGKSFGLIVDESSVVSLESTMGKLLIYDLESRGAYFLP